MSTTAKGNKLEDAFHSYLLDQQRRGEAVFGVHHPDRCIIHKKKKYPSKDRGTPVQFDVVIEIYGEGRRAPHITVVFECKNYNGDVPEVYVREFSDKLKEIFPNGAKGVIVTSSRLKSGAENVARSRNMGIVKYDQHGLEFIVDRRGLSCLETPFVQSQIFRTNQHVKSLKFSAYHDGNFFGTFSQFLRSLAPQRFDDNEQENAGNRVSVPYVPADDIRAEAQKVLELIDYKLGPVDLEGACAALSINLQYTNKALRDADGTFILGSADFDRNLIQIHAHGNDNRQRFTLAHEIGHFSLQHKKFLRSEMIIESDLMIDGVVEGSFNYERLELQANIFASFLILPDSTFRIALDVARKTLDIRDRTHGYIYVDDQPVNYGLYQELLALLSDHFKASQQAIEIRLKSLGLVNDQRKRNERLVVGQALGALAFRE